MSDQDQMGISAMTGIQIQYKFTMLKNYIIEVNKKQNKYFNFITVNYCNAQKGTLTLSWYDVLW